jgi:hypothetical protein
VREKKSAPRKENAREIKRKREKISQRQEKKREIKRKREKQERE